MIRPLTSANVSYGVTLPPVTQTSDGALFYKTAPDLGGLNPIGLYIFNFQQDFNSVLPGEQVQTGWTRLTDEVGKYLLKTGDTMTGNLTMGANRLVLGPLNTDWAEIYLESAGDQFSSLVFQTADNVGNKTESFIWRMTGPGDIRDVMSLNEDGLIINGSKVWHSGNDGAGSGLDADTMDGQNGSYYLNLANATGTLPNSMLTNKMFYDFGSNAAVSSPTPDTFPAGSISGFDAYNTSDMGAYQVGLQVIGVPGGGARSMQLSANWNSEETAPAQLRFRTNDDTSDKTAWSPWSTILLAEGVGLATQILQSSGSSAPTWVNQSTITSGATLSVNILQDATIHGLTVGRGGNPSSTNTALGSSALYRASPLNTGSQNTAIGANTLYFNTGGNFNSALGFSALSSNTNGSENVAVGDSALISNLTGNKNVALGRSAGQNNTTGQSNVSIGYAANSGNTTSSYNVAIGANTLLASTGGENTVIGFLANSVGGAGAQNVALGYRALYTNRGSNNIGLGHNAGSEITTGNYNVVLGSNNGLSIGTSNNNIIISDGQGNIRITVDADGVTNINGSLTVGGTAVGGGGGSAGAIIKFFTAGSTSWTCPTGVTTVWVSGAGGGGAGMYQVAGEGGFYNIQQGGLGGSCYRHQVTVVPGTIYPIVIGTGVGVAATEYVFGSGGSATTLGSLVTLGGGYGLTTGSTPDPYSKAGIWGGKTFGDGGTVIVTGYPIAYIDNRLGFLVIEW